MDARSKRREATRRQLEQQLKERQAREARRKRATLITSIVGTVAVIALVVVLVVVFAGGTDDKKPKAGASAAPTTASSSVASSAASSAAPVPLPTTACSAPPKGSTASFAGLTVTGTTDLKKAPVVTGKAPGADPTALRCADLVVGTGAKATTSAQGTVEYVGLVYKTGKVFQSSWDSSPATFGLASGPNGVIAGFSQGIAGAGKVAPMRVGGRRVILMPASVAYGATPPSGSGIPANAALVFVVDLQKVS